MTVLLLASGCGQAESPATRSAPPDPPIECPSGSVAGLDGSCNPVGIQGCAKMFLREDGLCLPTMAACPAGTIPKFDEGCISVGPLGCAAEFMMDDGLCHPAMTLCPEGAFAVPQEGCVPIDGPSGCGPGRWGDIPDAPNTVYVDASSETSGDGSKALPLKTISEALAAAEEDATIAVAEGTYEEQIVIDTPVEIVGRCPSKVRIRGVATADDVPTVLIDAAHNVTIRGVEIDGGYGVRAQGGATAKLERVHIKEALLHAAVASGNASELTVDHSWIERTLPGARDRAVGVTAGHGGSVTVRASAVIGSRLAGVWALNAGSAMHVIGSLIEDTRGLTPGAESFGARVDAPATMTVEQSALVSNEWVGMLAFGSGSEAVATGILIERTLPGTPTSEYGNGFVAFDGAHATVDGSVFLGNSTTGVGAFGQGSEILLTRSLVQDTKTLGREVVVGGGLNVAQGAKMEAIGNALYRNYDTGIMMDDTSEATLTSNLIEETLPMEEGSDRETGLGAWMVQARLTLDSNAIIKNRLAGVVSSGDSSELVATNNIVGYSVPTQRKRFGRGVHLRDISRATLTGNVVTDNFDIGISLMCSSLNAAGEVVIQGGLVQDTTEREHDGSVSTGVYAYQCGVDLSTSVLRRHAMAAVLLQSATARIRQSTFDSVPLGKATLESGMTVEFGDGILVTQQSTADLDGVAVSGCGRAGILYSDSSGSVARTRASGNRFGLVLTGSSKPTLGDDTSFTDNSEQDRVDGGDLPVPDRRAELP